MITVYFCTDTPDDWGDGTRFLNASEAREYAEEHGLAVVEVRFEFSDSEQVQGWDFRDEKDG